MELLKDALDSVSIYRNSSLGMTMDDLSYTNISPGENFNAVGSESRSCEEPCFQCILLHQPFELWESL